VRRAGAGLMLLAAGAAAGCSYYNGMYNVKQLAGSARHAERDGRTGEAGQDWNLVATKAESVLIKHPHAKWADEARVLQGTALGRLHQCPRATGLLEQVVLQSRDQSLVEDAASVLGRCRLEENDVPGALLAFRPLLNSKDHDRRSEARYQYGRALRLAGQNAESVDQLKGSDDPRARGERAAALAALGRGAEAIALADSLVADRDTTAPWPVIAEGIAQSSPEPASALVDSVGSFIPSRDLKASLLLDDGRRWLARDTSRGFDRLNQAAVAGAGLPTGGLARLTAARARLSRTDTTAELPLVAQELDMVGDEPGPYAPAATLLAGVSRRTQALADSVTGDQTAADLRTFMAGEMARDSLEAKVLAARLFHRVTIEWPDSPFAPKAILALMALEPGRADSLRQVLTGRYADSPYLAILNGDSSPGYAALEDSLRGFVASLRTVDRPLPGPLTPRPGQRPAGSPRRPIE
jgi:hypothetical protein